MPSRTVTLYATASGTGISVSIHIDFQPPECEAELAELEARETERIGHGDIHGFPVNADRFERLSKITGAKSASLSVSSTT